MSKISPSAFKESWNIQVSNLRPLFLCLFLFKSVRQVLPVEFERSSTAQLREKRISALRGLFTHGRRVASAADSQQGAARNSLCSVFSVCAEFIGLWVQKEKATHQGGRSQQTTWTSVHFLHPFPYFKKNKCLRPFAPVIYFTECSAHAER